MTTKEIIPGAPEKPVSGLTVPLYARLEVEIPTLPLQALYQLLDEGRRMVGLAQRAHDARGRALAHLNALKDEGCAPGTWYEKKGRYLVLEQRIDGKRIRRYIGSDPTKKAEAMAPYLRYRKYLEILDLVAILDRVIARLLRHTKDLNADLERTTKALAERQGASNIQLLEHQEPPETPPQEDIPPL